MTPSPPSSTLIAWGQLVRLPNTFTILADVGAAFLLVAHGAGPSEYLGGRFVCVLIAGVCLYWAGMILNDIRDIETDQAERSSRPLAAGTIPLNQAQWAVGGLFALGILIAGASGHVPCERYPTTWLPLVIAISLAITIVAYDGPLKKTPLAPAAMGGCRVLSFLLGASPLLGTIDGFLIPKYLLGIAAGFGTYIMGLTLFGRREAVGGPSLNLPMGTLITLLGAVMLALAPQLERAPIGWHIDVRVMFPTLIGLVAFPVVLRAYRAVKDPTPAKIQTTMRIGILTIIPLAAAFAFLGAGQAWGLAIFALVIPSLALASRFRVT